MLVVDICPEELESLERLRCVGCSLRRALLDSRPLWSAVLYFSTLFQLNVHKIFGKHTIAMYLFSRSVMYHRQFSMLHDRIIACSAPAEIPLGSSRMHLNRRRKDFEGFTIMNIFPDCP